MSAQVDPIGTGQPVAYSNGQPSTFFVRQWNNLINLVFDVRDAAAAALAAATAAAAAAASAATAIAGIATLNARNINTSGGLSGGGNLSADRTLIIDDTAVTPGTYGDATHVGQFTVNQKGQLTAASNVAISSSGSSDISPFSDGGITKPAAADFTIADDTTSGHGTGSKTDLSHRGVELTNTRGSNSTTQSLYSKSAVSNTLVSVIAYVAPNFHENNANNAYLYGLAVRDNTGKIDSFCLTFNSAEGCTEWKHATFTNISTAPTIGALTGGHMAQGRPVWLKLAKVSTNFVFSVSYNGETYQDVTTVSATGFIGSTINDVGIVLYNALGAGSTVVQLGVFSFAHS